MGNELTYHSAADSGSTIYAMLENVTGQVWNGSTFVAPVSADWDNYDIPMTEQATSTGIFRANMPSADAGVYCYIVRQRAGGSPAVTDLVLDGTNLFTWDGSAIVTAALLLLAARSEPGQANPAVNANALTKIDNLYKNWRNKKTQGDGWFRLFDDAATVVDQKAEVSDDGTTIKTKMVSGP